MKKWFKSKLGQQRSASTYSVDSDQGAPGNENGFQIYGLTNYNQNNNAGNSGAQSHNLLNNLNQVQSANYELKEINGATRRAINFEKFNHDFKQDEMRMEKKKSEMYHLKKQNLPVDFAGRVLKLEMQIEKGLHFTTTDDVQNLMDLYTQAVEFYNSTQQMDRQKYYETKLHKLMNSPHIKKLYKLHFEREAKKLEDGTLKSDGSTSARKLKTMSEVLDVADMQKKKNLMNSAIHQQQRELEAPEQKESDEKQIKKQQMKQMETQKLLKNQMDKNREDIQKRIAERARRRTSSRGKFNQSMLENSAGLVAFSNTLKNQNSEQKGVRAGRVAGSILLPQTSNVDLTNQNYQSTPQMKKNKYVDREFQLGKGSGDYVKNLLQQNNSFMKSSGLFDKMKSPMGAGPKFGQSKLGMGMSSNTSNYSGSQTSTGGGIASRFQLALSRVIDPTSVSSMGGNTAAQDDDDIIEMRSLIDELNQHQDLTVKLSNQAKLCKVFSKAGTSQKNTSLMKRKLEQNLQNLDPEIKKIFNDCRIELENLQQKKEQAQDEFIEQQTENKIVQQRKIERKFKKRMADVDKSIKSLQSGEKPDQHKEAIQMLETQKAEVEKEKQKDIEEFVKEQDNLKKKGMQDIKDEFNKLCQQINLDANVLITAIQKKKLQQREALEKQKANSSEQKKEEPVAPVQVEDMSDKGISPLQDGESDFNSFAQTESRPEGALQKQDEEKTDDVQNNKEEATAIVS